MNQAHPASLELRAATLTVGREEVLHPTDLHVLPGELFVVLGTADSGKSGLLRAIAGLDRLSAGQILLDGRVISHTPARRRDVALMLQSFPLWPHLDVGENVAFAAKRRGLGRHAVRERVMHELAFVGLTDFVRHLPSQLSPGQRQRVALARTLAADSHLCLLDEPFSAQSPQLREQLRGLLRRRQQQIGFTTLLATPDPDLALRIADRIAVLHSGELHQVGTPLELYDTPQTRQVATLTGAANLIDGEIELAGDQAMFHGENGVVIPLFDHALRRSRTGTAMFRPQALHIVSAEQAPIGDEIRLNGRIEEIEFMGDKVRYVIDLAGKTAYMDFCRDSGQQLYNVGDPVVLGLDPAHIRILEH